MADIEYMKKLAEKFAKGEIPFLEDKDQFEFACDQCGRCCRNRSDILLSPLDVYHLTKAKGMTGQEILAKYGDRYIGEHSKLPVVRLKYRQELDGQTTCYFLGRKDGKCFCRVHEYKPTVCRTYPLGKMQSAKKDASPEEPVYPKYFLQEEDPHSDCIGIKRAHREHVKQTVVDWVGGPRAKAVADRYSVIFNEFTQKYHQVFDYEKFEKNADPVSFKVFFGTLEVAMYADYAGCPNDCDFLQKLQYNLDMCIELAKQTNRNPRYVLDVMERGLIRLSGQDAV